jgi:hypothetical protein
MACWPVARRLPRGKQKKKIQQPLLSNGFANKHVWTATIGYSKRVTVFSVRSVPRCYNQDNWSNDFDPVAGSNTSTAALRVVGGDEKGKQCLGV